MLSFQPKLPVILLIWLLLLSLHSKANPTTLLNMAALHIINNVDSTGNPANALTDIPNAIDEQLYSRQIFVYGKSAQQSLSSSHVLIRGSNTALTAEIVKNLALAGVGWYLRECI